MTKKVLMVVKSSVFSCELWFTPVRAREYAKKVIKWYDSLPFDKERGELTVEFKHGKSDT